jgi:hypothetical protein
MTRYPWPEDHGHGALWHAVMSVLTIVAMGAVLLLAGVALAAPR